MRTTLNFNPEGRDSQSVKRGKTSHWDNCNLMEAPGWSKIERSFRTAFGVSGSDKYDGNIKQLQAF